MREKNTYTLEIKKDQREERLSQREKVKKRKERGGGFGKF